MPVDRVGEPRRARRDVPAAPQGGGVSFQPSRRFVVTPAEIVEAVAYAWNVTPRDLLSPSREVVFQTPRKVAFYLVREMTQMSNASLGRLMERDHTTVARMVKELEAEMEVDSELALQVKLLRQDLDEYVDQLRMGA